MACNSSKRSRLQPLTVVKTARCGSSWPATKQEIMLKMLRRARGASIADLTDATGWQSHSVRAALSVLRKRDIEVLRELKNNVSRYRVPIE